MRTDFNAFRAHLIKLDSSRSSRSKTPVPVENSPTSSKKTSSHPDVQPQSPKSTPATAPLASSSTPTPTRKRLLQTFVPTKVFAPVDVDIGSAPPRIASHTENPIGFLIPGRGARGIPLRDLIEGDAAGKMAWSDMFLFQNVEYGEIDVFLSWPGYVGHERTQRIDLYANGERMPLKALAKNIGRFVSEYLQTCKSLQCLDRYAKWRIADDKLGPNDVTVVSLVNTYANVWQPELAIERTG